LEGNVTTSEGVVLGGLRPMLDRNKMDILSAGGGI